MAFTIYLHGEDSYNVTAFGNIDKNTSEVNLTDLTEPDYTKWLAVQVLGLDEEYSDAIEKIRYTGASRDYGAQIISMTLNFADFKFPDDYETYQSLINVLNMKYKFLHKGDYPVDIHAGGKAICFIKGARNWTHDYEKGIKTIVQEIERMYTKK